jgi:LysR family hydrogen peroxide-inducible transcriptional activator
MTLTQLEYIVAVDTFRHFGKAAKSRSVTQPTLSMQLSKAEEEIGIILFDRSKNPIIPTLEGEKIIQQARIVLREYKKIFAILDSEKNELHGKFNLGVIPTLAPYLIPLFAGNFAKKYPNVDLTIEEYKTEKIIELLYKDELDAGILVTPLHEDGMIERVLFNEAFYVFSSTGHPHLKKAKLKTVDLKKDDIWLLNEGHCFRGQVLNLCGIKTEKESYSNLHFESGNLETLKNMAMNNGGFTLLPHLAVLNLNETEMEHVREFSTPIPTREVSIIHNRVFLKEKIITALENEIVNGLPKAILSHKKNIETIPI